MRGESGCELGFRSGKRGGLLLLQVANEAAGDNDLALPREQVVGERDLLVAVDLARDVVEALRDLLQAGEASW